MPSLRELATAVNELTEAQAIAEKNLKDIKTALKAAEAELWERMEEEGLDNARSGEYTFTRKDTPHYSCRADNQDDLYRALRREGFGSLIRETVHAGTLNAFVKEQVNEHGGALPEYMEGLVDVYYTHDISRRKA